MQKAAVALGAISLIAALSGCTTSRPPEAPAAPSHLELSDIDVADSSRNGIEYLEGADALNAALSAARAAHTVTMIGEYTRHPVESEGEPTLPGGTLQVQFSGGTEAFTANITSGQRAVEVIGVGGLRYVREATTDSFECYSAEAPQLAEWKAVLDPIGLLETLFAGATLSTSAVREASIDILLESNGGTAGALTVASIDEALPLRAVLGDVTSSVALDFSGWGAKVVKPAVPTALAASCD